VWWLPVNGLELGSAAVLHWPLAIWEENFNCVHKHH
jgi:hypothetical protein